jgi:hypothetical protein
MTEEELERLKGQYSQLAERARGRQKHGVQTHANQKDQSPPVKADGN